jgi:hypothetical protein
MIYYTTPLALAFATGWDATDQDANSEPVSHDTEACWIVDVDENLIAYTYWWEDGDEALKFPHKSIRPLP